jgi:hypothetical protein
LKGWSRIHFNKKPKSPSGWPTGPNASFQRVWSHKEHKKVNRNIKTNEL